MSENMSHQSGRKNWDYLLILISKSYQVPFFLPVVIFPKSCLGEGNFRFSFWYGEPEKQTATQSKKKPSNSRVCSPLDQHSLGGCEQQRITLKLWRIFWFGLKTRCWLDSGSQQLPVSLLTHLAQSRSITFRNPVNISVTSGMGWNTLCFK